MNPIAKVILTLNSNVRTLIWIFLCTTTTIGCNSDDMVPETFLCCTENPFASSNVDNLDSSSVEIEVFEVFTPNGDAINDFFLIQNIEFHTNNSVTIFDLGDNIIFEVGGYNNQDRTFIGRSGITGDDLDFGSYKYKIVLENEQTFVEFGYVCLLRDTSEINGFDFSNCNLFNFNDPVFN